MKKYEKIMDVLKYEEQAKKQINLIKELQKEDAKKYDFKLEKDTKNEQFYTLRKYYDGELRLTLYNTIDIIMEHLKAIKQTIIDLK